MPPYDSIGREQAVLVFGIGLLLVAAIALARGGRTFGFSIRARSEEELAEDVHEFGGGVREGNRPVPLFIWLVFGGYFVWAVAYILFSAHAGV